MRHRTVAHDVVAGEQGLHDGRLAAATTCPRRVVQEPGDSRARRSKSQEIHPKTGGGGGGALCSLRASASATLITAVRRRNSHHAVFVDDSRTAVLKDVVIHAVIHRWRSLDLISAKRHVT